MCTTLNAAADMLSREFSEAMAHLLRYSPNVFTPNIDENN